MSVSTVLFHGQNVTFWPYIMLLKMDAKDVRNMYSILVVFNKHSTARVESYWFIIYYRPLKVRLATKNHFYERSYNSFFLHKDPKTCYARNETYTCLSLLPHLVATESTVYSLTHLRATHVAHNFVASPNSCNETYLSSTP